MNNIYLHQSNITNSSLTSVANISDYSLRKLEVPFKQGISPFIKELISANTVNLLSGIEGSDGNQGSGGNSSYDSMLLQKLSELRKIPEFSQAEVDAKKRWDEDIVFQIDTGEMSNADEHVISVNPNDVGIRYEVHRKPEEPEWLVQLEQQDQVKYWEAYDKWEAENFTKPVSWERLLTHELMHSAYGSTNFIVSDHHKIIGKTNEIMSDHYNEVDRHPHRSDGF